MTRGRATARAVAALAACAALALAGCTGSGGNGKDYRFTSFTTIGRLVPEHQRKPAQDFSGDLLEGGHTSLAHFRGHVTVVNFFASWCGPCQVETPQLALFAKQTKKQGIDVLGIDTKDDRGSARTFVKQNGVGYPVLYDQQGRTALTLGNIPANLPFTVLVDKSGKVAAVYRGQISDKDLEHPIDMLSSER